MPTLPFFCNGNPISSAGVNAAMTALGVDAATMWAMLTVETPGSGFLADRRPRILFERHVFHRLTGGVWDGSHPGISNAVPGGYGNGGPAQYGRLAEAVALDQSAALKSASWGIGQVMGENFAVVGFGSVEAMVTAMCESEDQQLEAVFNFVVSKGLQNALQEQDWTTYAKGYNGPDYAENNYDLRLARDYSNYSDGVQFPDLTVRAAQSVLLYLDYDPMGIDGVVGKNTLTALHMFQAAQGIPLTTGIDDGVMASLTAALPAAGYLSLV